MRRRHPIPRYGYPVFTLVIIAAGLRQLVQWMSDLASVLS